MMRWGGRAREAVLYLMVCFVIDGARSWMSVLGERGIVVLERRNSNNILNVRYLICDPIYVCENVGRAGQTLRLKGVDRLCMLRGCAG